MQCAHCQMRRTNISHHVTRNCRPGFPHLQDHDNVFRENSSCKMDLLWPLTCGLADRLGSFWSNNGSLSIVQSTFCTVNVNKSDATGTSRRGIHQYDGK